MEDVKAEPLRFSFTASDKSCFVFQVTFISTGKMYKMSVCFRLHQKLARLSGCQL